MQTIYPFLSTENKNLEWHSLLALLLYASFIWIFSLNYAAFCLYPQSENCTGIICFLRKAYLIFSMLYYLNMYRFILGGVPSFWVQDHIGIFSTCKDKGKGNINVFYSARKVQFRLSLCPSSTGRLLSIFPSQ